MHASQWKQGVSIGLLVLVIVWLGTLIVGLIDKAHIAVSQAHEAEEQYRALEKRKKVLESNLAALVTERGQDMAIRTAFGVARPGEEVIVVVPPTITVPTTTPSWWERVWSWF